MIKIDWNSWIKNRVWFGWLWRSGWSEHETQWVPTLDDSKGIWRRISSKRRFIPVELAWKFRGGHPRG